MTLLNLGEGEARGVQFTDPLPAGLTWSISPASAGWSIADGNLVYSPTTLAPGAVTTVHVVATTDGTDCGQVDNLAAVTTSNDADRTPRDASIDVNCGQIDVQKVADDERVSAGDQIGFTVTLANTGDGEAGGSSSRDVLPTGLTWSISPASAGWSIQGQDLVYRRRRWPATAPPRSTWSPRPTRRTAARCQHGDGQRDQRRGPTRTRRASTVNCPNLTSTRRATPRP